ncbi:MAG TPA: COX15/CtaA family protein [Solirubrobacterales bacterium]|jgi:cytochrome c oxidase assembly protein subunit 15|nr:COX15/CtaA family protein [Solirubrobacterales bacterium]HMX71691.1 COX15/CtaA family protein [Solirubrobacterales bacterium]HMY25776.1 COX15/CtaA family protein [Solirubrobacterales bacterium]HNA43951.1 COX15/CtaA family protein [Solirubrobacterales bacterium]HNC94177.1 COX15/CtaA family protein [Solirubrobacterales bacterium]
MPTADSGFLNRIRSFSISPETYQVVTLIALVVLVIIVFTGAAVRLTASGLGCPDWPKCYGGVVAPPQINAWIEYGNRLVTGVVSITVIAAALLAFLRKPYRWHLAFFGILLPLGVIGQAILGAFVVYYHLPPELVIFHFILSMILIDAAFALFWCSRYEPGERRYSTDWVSTWAVRALIPIGQLTIFLGTITTASGPHPGDHDEELVRRFDFKGTDTLEWVVQRHAAIAVIFGLSVLAVIFIIRRQGGDRRAQKPLIVTLGLICLQLAVGITQWLLHLPAGLVWVHVVVATLLWLAVLWSVAAAGQITPGTKGALIRKPEAAPTG